MGELPIFSERELLNYDGEQTRRILIAYQGIVYDVTDCPKWRNGLHEGQHFPGQNLTQELDLEAPHSTEVFEHPCVKKAGVLLE
jgi:predicted heme/steroid binding protein